MESPLNKLATESNDLQFVQNSLVNSQIDHNSTQKNDYCSQLILWQSPCCFGWNILTKDVYPLIIHACNYLIIPMCKWVLILNIWLYAIYDIYVYIYIYIYIYHVYIMYIYHIYVYNAQ